MTRFYRLDNGVVRETDVDGYIEQYKNDESRRVAKDEVAGVVVSTVFLALDHGWTGKGPPVLFETMIFGGEHDGYQERCCTLSEAIQMHAVALELVRGKKV